MIYFYLLVFLLKFLVKRKRVICRHWNSSLGGVVNRSMVFLRPKSSRIFYREGVVMLIGIQQSQVDHEMNFSRLRRNFCCLREIYRIGRLKKLLRDRYPNCRGALRRSLSQYCCYFRVKMSWSEF